MKMYRSFPLFKFSTRHNLKFLCIVLCWLIFASAEIHGQTAPADSQPNNLQSKTTWLIVRHAERDGDSDALTDAGKQRASLLAELGQALNVTAIYSTDFQRTRATVTPLAEALNLPIHLYRQPSLEGLTAGGNDFSGQVILVVGHSNTVGQMVASLADVAPFELEHGEYDGLFIVTVEGEKKNFVRLNFGSSRQSSTPLPLDKMGPQDVRPGNSASKSDR